MHKFMITTLMLVCSNVFMTFTWYGHLKNYNDKPWIIAAIISWGITLYFRGQKPQPLGCGWSVAAQVFCSWKPRALARGASFEYLLQVPANRIGHQVMSLGQLKILLRLRLRRISLNKSLMCSKLREELPL